MPNRIQSAVCKYNKDPNRPGPRKQIMSIVLTIYFLASKNAQALPIRADQTIDQSAPALCSDIHNCRTIWNIIWSCAVTIFGCTWVAVHPNIPNGEGKWFMAGFRRLKLMVMAVIAPEMVILWALRQWLAACKLAKKHHKSVFVFDCGLFK